MKKLLSALVLSVVACGVINSTIVNPSFAVADDIDKILKAKEIVRNMVNYPDTLVFYEFSTVVKGNVVTLKFSCKNGFGVSETHTLDVNVN
jgi:hypothetical protein